MRDPTLRQPIGIWRSVAAIGGYRFTEVIWPEVTFASVIGAGGTVAVVQSTNVNERVPVVGDLFGVSVAFLAVVFAALAIVVALPASRYLNLLGETRDGGMRKFLEPFLVAAGTQIALVVLTVAYRLMAKHVPAGVEHATFYVVGFLFVFGVLDIGGLARQLVKHGVYRAADAADEVKREAEAASVHHLGQKR